VHLHEMRRREIVALLGSAAVCPFAARAQQPAMPVIGYLGAGWPDASTNLVASFRKGLSQVGYVEGRNVAIEFRWAHNENERLPDFAADLVHHGVQVIVTQITTLAASAAKAATTSIPVVFGIGSDPVRAGLVASFNRPGGNVTGVTTMSIELLPKRLGLLQKLLPNATRFAVLVNPTTRLVLNPRPPTRARYLPPSDGKSKYSRRVPVVAFTRFLQPSHTIGRKQSRSHPMACSTTVAYNSPRWRRGINSPRSIGSANLPKWAA